MVRESGLHKPTSAGAIFGVLKHTVLKHTKAKFKNISGMKKLWTPGKKSNEASSSAAALAPPAPQELPDSEWKSRWTVHELGKLSIPLGIDHES